MHERAASGANYEVRVSGEPTDPTWDAFVASLPHGHYVQTSLWGRTKQVLGYRAMRVMALENGRVVAGGQLLVRRLLPLLSIAYIPRGPLLPTWDPSLAHIVVDEIKEIARAHRFPVVALQPPDHAPEFEAFLANRGFCPSWLELAPTATLLVDLAQDTDQILGQMKRQTRQKIRRSERQGITTREGTGADLAAFYQLHVTTSRRQDFAPYPQAYFERMWQVFSEQDLIGLLVAEYQGTLVSALMVFSFGHTAVGDALGWSGQHTERKPTDAVVWAAIRWAKARGCRFFDMGGIDREGAEVMLSGQPLPEALRLSPDMFKLGYGGTITLLPRSYYHAPGRFWRWLYARILGSEGPGPAIQETLERFRRRFG